MKYLGALLIIGASFSVAACQSKPKTDDTAIDLIDSTATMPVDSAAVSTDTTAIVVPADTTR